MSRCWRAEDDPAVAQDLQAPADSGAGWTFGVLGSLGPAPNPSALARTVSVAQPPELNRGTGGCTLEPFVSKMFPPEGTVSFASSADAHVVWQVTIEWQHVLPTAPAATAAADLAASQ